MRLQPEMLKNQPYPPERFSSLRFGATEHHKIIGVPYEHADLRTPLLPDPIEHMQIDVRK